MGGGSYQVCMFLQPKVVFHQRVSSTKGGLPPKVVFHQRLSSTNGRLPTEGRLPMNVIFQRRSSSTKVCLPTWCMIHDAWCKHLSWSYIWKSSEHTKSQPHTLLRSGRGGSYMNGRWFLYAWGVVLIWAQSHLLVPLRCTKIKSIINIHLKISSCVWRSLPMYEDLFMHFKISSCIWQSHPAFEDLLLYFEDLFLHFKISSRIWRPLPAVNGNQQQ